MDLSYRIFSLVKTHHLRSSLLPQPHQPPLSPPCPPNPPTLTYLVTWNRSGSPPDQNQPAHRYTINTLKGDISVKYILKRPYLHYTTSWKSSIYGSAPPSATPTPPLPTMSSKSAYPNIPGHMEQIRQSSRSEPTCP